MHINWDVFNAITLAVWIYVLIPIWGVALYEWIKHKRQIRRDRKQLEQLLAQAEATRDQPTQP